MPETLTTQPDDTAQPSQDLDSPPEPLVTETLVEEVSIDGMCGVY